MQTIYQRKLTISVGFTVAALLAALLFSVEGSLQLLLHLLQGDAYMVGRASELVYRSIATHVDQAVFEPLDVIPQNTQTKLLQARASILAEYNSFQSSVSKIPTLPQVDTAQPPSLFQDWEVLFLELYGRKTCVYQNYFPKTLQAISESGIPAVSVMFSKLRRGQSLPRHRGPTRIVLRLLLAISIPSPTIVNGTAITSLPYLKVWECGFYFACDPTILPFAPTNDSKSARSSDHNNDMILFDDTYPHLADNPTDHDRIVLFLDVRRHDIISRGWLLDRLIHFGLRMFPNQHLDGTVQRTNQLLCGA